MRTTARKLTALSALTLSLLACATAAVPAPISRSDADLLATVHFPAVVGVERYEYPVYSERLIASLRSTGLFREVGRLEEIDDPDLVASVRRQIYGTASLTPVLTIVTLGIVPTIGTEEWGESFTLRSAAGGGSAVPIEFSYSGPTTLGWAALFRAPSPRHALGRPYDKPRFQEAFAVAIAEKAAEIDRLLERQEHGR